MVDKCLEYAPCVRLHPDDVPAPRKNVTVVIGDQGIATSAWASGARFRMGVVDISGIFLYVLMKAASRLAAQKRWGTHGLWTFFQDRRFSTLAG